MHMIAQICLLAFPLLMIVAAWRDLISYTIPNWISLWLVAGFVVTALVVHLPWMALGLHVGVGVGVLVLTMIMFALGWIGGGDAKLLAAASLWMGWPHVIYYIAAAAIWGGVLTIALILLRKAPLPPVFFKPKWAAKLLARDGDVPYGIALCAGGLMAYPHSPLFLLGMG